MSHLGFMTLYAALLGTFFSALWKRERPAQIRLFAQVFLGLVGGGIALGWIVFFLPSAPPAPIP